MLKKFPKRQIFADQNMLRVPVDAFVLAVSADTVATNATGGSTAKCTVHLFAHQSSSAHNINH